MTISESLIQAIKRKAKEKGLTPDEYVVSLIEGDLSIEERKELYLTLHKKYKEEAEDYLKKHDIVQACEKYWGTVTALLSAIAVERGWRHYTHRDYSEIIERLSTETGDLELLKLFAVAERLHANYCHGFIKPETMPAYKESIEKLLEKLRKILA